MDKRFLYLFVGAGLLILVAILSLFLNFGQTNNLNKFVENFVADFSTYSMSDTNDYNTRISKYIDPIYASSFADKFNLPRQDYVPKEEAGNYSVYQSSSVSTDDKSSLQKTVNVTYRAKKVDAPGRPNEFLDEQNATLIVKKDGNSYKIINFYFSTP